MKVASTAVVCQMMGLNREETLAAVSLAWVDGQSLRTYRRVLVFSVTRLLVKIVI